MRELNPSVEFANKTGLAYSAVCKPLCQKLHLPQTAFDILMFLANNPSYTTARDIVEVRHIKANLVSVNVDKLVQEGFLERRPVPQNGACLHRKGAVHHRTGPQDAGWFHPPPDGRAGGRKTRDIF